MLIQVHEGEDKRTLDPGISRQSSFVETDLRSVRSDSGLEDMNRMESGLGKLWKPIFDEWNFPPYQLEQFISVLRDVGWNFHFYSNFNRTFCKQIVETLIRPHILWCLIWVFTICLCPKKKMLGLYGLKFYFHFMMQIINSANWVIFYAFLWSADFFSNQYFSDKFFQEYHQSVKHFGSRSGRTFCRLWSGSKLFAKVISRQHQ